jgi:pimeloyl-ACP methyl ester carboxylesterase
MAQAWGNDGQPVHYRVVGDETGYPVVLLQGLGLAGDFWADVPERLAALASGPYRVCVVDNRGVGASRLRRRRPFAIRRMADDVAAVLDAEKIERAIVAGISLGGMIAQHVALRHPARVAGLVLMATTGGGRRLRLPGPLSLARLVSVPFGDLRGRRPNVDAFARLVLPASELGRAREHMRDLMPAFDAHEVSLPAFFAQLGAVLDHLRGADVAKIRCPTLVMAAEEDCLLPPRNAELLAQGIPGAHFEVAAGVGHGIPILDRDAVGRAVSRLRQLQLSSAAP